MQQNKTASQGKTINPIYWVPTAYFAMGLPFIAINLVSVFMFKDLSISDTQITDRKSTRLNSSHIEESRMPSSA